MVIYILPYRSEYAHYDPYLEIQKEVDKYMSKSRNILLFGDFNSRTGLKCDFVSCDKLISESNGNEYLYNENLYKLHSFDKNDIIFQRNSADQSVYFYGQQLLEFCKSNIFFKWEIRHFVKNNNSTSSIPPLCSALPPGDNQLHFNAQDKANCLNDYFASISTVNDENTQLPPFTKLTDNSLSQIICTEQEI